MNHKQIAVEVTKSFCFVSYILTAILAASQILKLIFLSWKLNDLLLQSDRNDLTENKDKEKLRYLIENISIFSKEILYKFILEKQKWLFNKMPSVLKIASMKSLEGLPVWIRWFVFMFVITSMMSFQGVFGIVRLLLYLLFKVIPGIVVQEIQIRRGGSDIVKVLGQPLLRHVERCRVLLEHVQQLPWSRQWQWPWDLAGINKVIWNCRHCSQTPRSITDIMTLVYIIIGINLLSVQSHMSFCLNTWVF